MPIAKYIMKNHKVDLQSDKWVYCVYDAGYKHIYDLTLTPDQAKKLPLEALSPMQIYMMIPKQPEKLIEQHN